MSDWDPAGTGAQESQNKDLRLWIIDYFMTIFLFLMLLSSIYMFIIYISGGDFGHLNAFYFSLIFLTLCDGFTNAFAFAINAQYSSLLSAGIPLSGLLVTLLHYIYKFFYDLFLWDDFDYIVLELQLYFNIIFIFIALILWSVDLGFKVKSGVGANPVADPMELFNDKHNRDWSPILLLAISLGTVYAFYPSIAPYSIIDFQYASIIELWILIISALLPLTMAILDCFGCGPGGKVDFIPSYITDIKVTHGNDDTGGSGKTTHGGEDCSNSTSGAIAHEYGTYFVRKGDTWKLSTGAVAPTSGDPLPTGKAILLRNWWNGRNIEKGTNNISKAPGWNDYCKGWNLVWFCAIFYILCIQIFMSMLHYPHCLLSCFFNDNPYCIVFISILFNTLRELMQASAFSGAGKQCKNQDTTTVNSILTKGGSVTFANDGDILTDGAGDKIGINSNTLKDNKNKPGNISYQPTENPAGDQDKIKLKLTGIKSILGDSPPADYTGIHAQVSAFKTYRKISLDKLVPKGVGVNGTIAATNKLITLFVMMFCVFTVAVNDDVIDLIPPFKPKRNQ